MNKITNEHTKSIDEIYSLLDLIDGYLRDLEKRLCSVEENATYDDCTRD